MRGFGEGSGGGREVLLLFVTIGWVRGCRQTYLS